MILLCDFKKALIEIKKNKLQYLFLFFQFIYFSGLIKQFTTDIFLVFNILFTAALCLFAKKINKNNIVFIITAFIVFILINIAPSIIWGADYRLLLGYSGRLLLGILIVVYLKDNFYESFERLVYVLAFISIPLYIIQLAYVHFFDMFKWFSELVLTDERLYYGRDILTGHRYLLIFLVNSWGELRNSGFMWEPASFGAMIAWASVFNLFINKMKFNSHLLIFLIAGITTFSIGTYLYIPLILMLVLYYNKKNLKTLAIIVLLLVALVSMSQLNFVQNNIEMISDKLNIEESRIENISGGYLPERTSRVGAFFANIYKVIEQPFGYGLKDVSWLQYGLTTGPNGLMSLVRTWGVPIIFLLWICIYRIIKKMYQTYKLTPDIVFTSVVFLLLLLPIGGNPFYNQPLLISILLSGFIVKSNLNKNNRLTLNNEVNHA